MILNYLKIGLRNMRRNKLLTGINLLSLSLGIAASLMIYLFIQDERSFDAFHDKSELIYRMDEIQSFPGTNTQNVALTMPGMGPAMLRDYPEVVMYARFYGQGRRLYETDGKRAIIDKSVAVDSTFLRMFDFEMIEGDRATALDEPLTAIMTQSAADLFFDTDESIIGKTIQANDNEYQITGLLKDVPDNSHLQFDVLLSMTTVTNRDSSFNTSFGSNYLTTYLLFNEGVDIPALEAKMPDFLMRCMPTLNANGSGVNDFYKIFFQRLPDVHLASMDIEHDYHNHRKFNGQYLGIFGLVALFIILIASVNFMNLVTARAHQRAQEVGVRKTIGALKSQLFTQFVTESAMLSVFSFFIAVGLAFAVAPALSDLVGRDLSMIYFVKNPLLLGGAFIATVGLGFLAGIYPAFYLASFDPTQVIKGASAKGNKSVFRSSLVVLQFGLAIAMIISTLIVVQQLYFIENTDIGLNKDHILLVDMNEEANEVFTTLKSELTQSANVLGVTASGQRLGNNFHQWGFKLRTDTVQGLTPSNVHVDFDYLDVYEIEVMEGRGFDKERPQDDGYAFVINESFAKEIGIDNPIGVAAGHSWYPDDTLGTIIGVVEDFNFNSLHYDINTLSMVVHTEWGYDELSVKVNGQNVDGAIADVERVWNTLVPSWPFQYSFLDEHFDELYRSEQQMQSVVTMMALLAILIACMGLFGLAAISTEERTKEIGVRKVLGASVGQIMTHLSKNFAILVIVAFVAFSPLTYYVMGLWLENYSERITISPLVFALGFVCAFIIALTTVSYHTYRSANSNPIDALRDD